MFDRLLLMTVVNSASVRPSSPLILRSEIFGTAPPQSSKTSTLMVDGSPVPKALGVSTTIGTNSEG